MKARTRQLRPRAARQRGAALLVAISSIAILTAMAVEVAYDTRVSLQMAANARDALRAEYMARSAVAMSRLVLHFQQQLDQVTSGGGGLPPAIAAMLGGQQGQGAQQGQQGQQGAAGSPLSGLLGGGQLSIRLWELVPIESSAAALFLGGGLGGGDALAARGAAPIPAAQPHTAEVVSTAGGLREVGPSGPSSGPPPGAGLTRAGTPMKRAFADIEGSFSATIEDEDRKINVRQFDATKERAVPQAARLAELIKDPKWDFLFDQDDANGWRVQRKELLQNLEDWIDDNEVGSAYNDPTKGFEQGFGDENYLYDRLGDDRYKAKNAPFDSLDELYLVGGVTDAFMAAFGDKLSVYPDVNATINVNTDDPAQLMVNALLMSSPPGVPQPALADPNFMKRLQEALSLLRPLPFMSITPQQFANALRILGLNVDPLYLQATNTDNRSPFGTSSTTFHIKAEGVAGEVHHTIDAIVTFDRRAEALAQDQGRILHWHEE